MRLRDEIRTQMATPYAKFRPNRRGAASGDLLRKLGFASGNLIASQQAHSDGALWKFRFVERPYAAARFGRRFVILPLQNAGGAFLDCGVGRAANGETDDRQIVAQCATVVATSRNALFLRVALATCVQKGARSVFVFHFSLFIFYFL